MPGPQQEREEYRDAIAKEVLGVLMEHKAHVGAEKLSEIAYRVAEVMLDKRDELYGD